MGSALSGQHVEPEREAERLIRPLVSPNKQPIAKDHSALRQKSERIRAATDGILLQIPSTVFSHWCQKPEV